jgi:hypothetical protein
MPGVSQRELAYRKPQTCTKRIRSLYQYHSLSIMASGAATVTRLRKNRHGQQRALEGSNSSWFRPPGDRPKGARETIVSFHTEAAHEKTHKDTDNFLVTVGVRLNT